MCGLCGIVGSRRGYEALLDEIAGMSKTLAHRGPDDSGLWCSPDRRSGFGFRRLAIVDLSAAGHQPMESASGRFVLLMNGEIYNHRALRKELAHAYPFAGSSDTEVALAAIEIWGVDRAVNRFNGMFALAVWEAERGLVHLIRDRMGEKPLYYGLIDGSLCFASELKALRAHPLFEPRVDRAALREYLRLGYVPGPRSIYDGVAKLPPGHRLVVDGTGEVRELAPYWRPPPVSEHAIEPSGGVERLKDVLTRSVRLRMLADVPLGAFLSGGVDSSLIVALMQEHATKAVKTFSIGFEDAAYDESDFAREAANVLGTNHTGATLDEAGALDLVPGLPTVFDEPFADPSQLPMMLVSRLAKQEVTVCLSGDGADELFAGYGRFQTVDRVWSLAERVPLRLRRLVGPALRRTGSLADSGPVRRRASAGNRLSRLGSMLPRSTALDAYEDFVSVWPERSVPTTDGSRSRDPTVTLPRVADPVAGMLYLDQVRYLPDDILVKVDRATMSCSLEARAPMLDPEVIALAASVPTRMKMKAGGKGPLKHLLAQYLPTEMVHRPKMGFDVPIGPWLRGPLRPWGESLLDPGRIVREGLLDAKAISRAWSAHIEGRQDNSRRLWTVLMFQAWLDSHTAS